MKEEEQLPKEKIFLDGSNSSFEQFSENLFRDLVTATKQSNHFTTEDHRLYSIFPSFETGMTNFGNRLLSLTQKILHQARPGDTPDIGNLDKNVDDLSHRFTHQVVDVVDDFFEGVDTLLDEITGTKDLSKPQIVKHFHLQKKNDPTTQIFHADNLPRPQNKWKLEIDNGYGPFIPKITFKPHARVPLDPIFTKHRVEAQAAGRVGAAKALSLRSQMPKDSLNQSGPGGGKDTETVESYPHPYRFELMNLEIHPSLLCPTTPQMYKKIEETKCTWVDTPEKLDNLVATLKKAKEIAVDLEHHAYRTYQGFTCLIQISTRDEDFLVDAIELRPEIYKINEVFTDPSIVKVFHGADHDIEWLQHDFGVYVVNLFDTGQATRVLDFPFFSLAYLLKHYCGREVDKKYQLADWRIRPLPEEMGHYAQEDTHYLLYIYDRLRNETIERGNESNNLLRAVWSRSRELCLNMYEKPVFAPDGYLELYNKYNLTYNPIQLAVFSALYEWRDRIARQEDESVRYVLPNHMMFQMSTLMPTDVNSLLACCKPIPPLVHVHANSLILLVTSVKDNFSNSSESDGFGSNMRQSHHLPPEHRLNFMTDIPPSGRISGYNNNQFSYPFGNYNFGSVNIHKLISPVSHLPNSCSPSPVMTTEQLYRAAQWTDDKTHVTLLPSQTAILAKMNTDYMAHRPLPYSLFTENDEEEEDDDDEDDDEEDGEHDEAVDDKELSNRANARRTARIIARQLLLTPMKAAPSAFTPVSQSTEEPRPVPFNLDQAGNHEEKDTMEVVESKSGGIEDAVEDVGDEVTEEGHERKKRKKDIEEGFSDIPKSMAEIYKLSNKTRREKKLKKKLKKKNMATEPSSPFYVKQGYGNEKIDIHSKQMGENQDDPKSSVAFMKSIGWIDSSDNVNPSDQGVPSQPKSGPPDSQLRTSGGNSEKFRPNFAGAPSTGIKNSAPQRSNSQPPLPSQTQGGGAGRPFYGGGQHRPHGNQQTGGNFPQNEGGRGGFYRGGSVGGRGGGFGGRRGRGIGSGGPGGGGNYQKPARSGSYRGGFNQ